MTYLWLTLRNVKTDYSSEITFKYNPNEKWGLGRILLSRQNLQILPGFEQATPRTWIDHVTTVLLNCNAV